MKLSIVIPVYNVKDYLKKCLDSVFNQIDYNIEVILIDDGSTDGSDIICDKYKDIYKSIVKVIHQRNKGLSYARNVGISLASGEYIMLLDSDDWIEANSLKKILLDLQEYKPEVYIGNAYRVFEDNKFENKVEYTVPNGIYTGVEFIQKCYLLSEKVTFCAQFNIYCKEFILRNNLKFYEGILHEDELWTPQVFLRAEKVFNSSIFFYYHFCRNGSITQKKDKHQNSKDIIFVCNKLQFILKNYNKKEIWPFKERIAMLYLHAVNIGNLYEDVDFRPDRKFSIVNSVRIKTKIKAIAFGVSPKYYCKINKLLKRKE